MPLDLEWRETADPPGRWREFASAAALKAFVADPRTRPAALDGELRVRSRGDRGDWEVVTTAAALARWNPPTPPASLLAARWTVEEAIAASQARHVQRLRACLASAREDGLLEAAQVETMVSIFSQAVAGEGPAGRHNEPLAGRPGDIAPALARQNSDRSQGPGSRA